MKTKPLGTLLMPIAFMLAVCTVLLIPHTAYAAQASQDGVVLELTTDKAQYSAGDTIEGRAIVTNTNSFAIEDVTLDAILPAGLDSSLSGQSLDAASLASGESLTLDFTARVPADAKPADLGNNTTPGQSSGLAKTYDGAVAGALLVFAVLVASILVLAYSRKKIKGRHGLFTLALLLAFALPISVSVPSPEAFAGESSLSAKENITVKGEAYELEAQASYTMPLQTKDFSFSKIKASQPYDPLAGAEFALTLEDGSVRTATSGSGGTVSFTDIPFGTHSLVETKAPAGYHLGTSTYTITVSASGVNIDGQPIEQATIGNMPLLKSDEPTIDATPAGSSTISGDGVPYATVYVSLPDRPYYCDPVQVNGSGKWTVHIAGNPLQNDEPITAYQVEKDKNPSDVVTRSVD